MTCIVGMVHEGVVWMGADSAGISGWSLVTRKDPKIYRVGEALIGFTDSFRMGQLLGYKLAMPAHPSGEPVERFMCTQFIDAVRECLKAGGYQETKNERESAGDFLVGYRGRLFKVCSDYQVGESIDGAAAVGCGHELAVGALAVIRMDYRAAHPEHALQAALSVAHQFNAGVRPPWVIMRTPEGSLE